MSTNEGMKKKLIQQVKMCSSYKQNIELLKPKTTQSICMEL